MNPFVAAAGISGLTGLASGLMGDHSQRRANERNEQLQREFAQNGIRWRVADAEAAGLHPLAALGASPISFSPSIVGDAPMASAVSNMGQDISRAITATRTNTERRLAALSIERGELENAVLRKQLNEPVGPPFPAPDYWGMGMPGQGNYNGRGTPVMPGTPYEDQSMLPDVTYSRTASGGLHPVMPSQLSESLEADEFLGGLDWSLRNKLAPAVASIWNRGWGKLFNKQIDYGKPSRQRLPKGAVDWEFHLTDRSWHPVWSKDRNYLGEKTYRRK